MRMKPAAYAGAIAVMTLIGCGEAVHAQSAVAPPYGGRQSLSGPTPFQKRVRHFITHLLLASQNLDAPLVWAVMQENSFGRTSG